MKDSTLISFGYRARSGKDTAASTILKQRGENYSIDIIHFAKPLKQEVNEMAIAAGGMRELFNKLPYTVPDWVQYDPENPMDDPLCPLGKQRALLQFHGTEFRRAQDEHYWTKKHAEAVEKTKARYVLVPDLRFPNEMDYVRSSHGVTIKVDRPGLPPATHASETALEDVLDWDYILYNGSTLEEFQDSAVFLFDAIADEPIGYGFGV